MVRFSVSDLPVSVLLLSNGASQHDGESRQEDRRQWSRRELLVYETQRPGERVEQGGGRRVEDRPVRGDADAGPAKDRPGPVWRGKAGATSQALSNTQRARRTPASVEISYSPPPRFRMERADARSKSTDSSRAASSAKTSPEQTSLIVYGAMDSGGISPTLARHHAPMANRS